MIARKNASTIRLWIATALKENSVTTVKATRRAGAASALITRLNPFASTEMISSTPMVQQNVLLNASITVKRLINLGPSPAIFLEVKDSRSSRQNYTDGTLRGRKVKRSNEKENKLNI